MNAFRLAANEIRRLASARLPRLALLALMLIPTLYGGLYLYANADPYANFSHVPAAVVSDDVGTTLSTGERLQVGDKVVTQIVQSRSFDWHEVTRDEALAGVQSGTYDFALLLPRDFSADLASASTSSPRRAVIELETNDANNYIATTIGNQVVKQVTASVAAEVSQTAASQLLAGFGTVHDNLAKAVDGAQRLSDGAKKAQAGAGQLQSGAAQLHSGLTTLASGAHQVSTGVGTAKNGSDELAKGAGTLSSGLRTLSGSVSGLPAQTDALADGAEQVAAGNAQVASTATQIADASAALKTDLGAVRTAARQRLVDAGLSAEQLTVLDQQLDLVDARVATADGKVQSAADSLQKLSNGASQVASGARTLADAMPALPAAVQRAASGADQLNAGAGRLSAGLSTLASGASSVAGGADSAVAGSQKLDDGARSLASGLGELAAGATSLHDQLAKGVDQIPSFTAAQREAMAATIGNPVSVDSSSLASAGSYGAGLAPMFMSLGLWIGAYTLFLLVRPLSSRALATNQHSLRTAIGGWLAPVAIGVFQVLALVAVVTWALDIRVAHPVLALLFLLLVSASFVAILHALSARLGAVGKFLGLVFMVLQLVSAGGTFPWQTLPGPLQAVHVVAPMSYAIDGLRRLMYGADLGPLALDCGVLLGFLAVSLLVSTVAARRQRVWSAARLKPDLAL